MGRSPKTEGASGRKAHLTAGDGASLRLSYFLPRFHEAARKIGVGYRQPPASTIPSANRNCTARLLPQSPAVTAPSRRELRRAAAVNAHDSFLRIVLSLTRPPGCPPVSISHGGFLRIVLSLTRPVSFHCAIPDFFHLSIDSVGTKCPKNTQPKTGAEAETHHPEPKRRVNLPMVPPGGFLRGEQFERERVVPPLSRTTFLPFLPEQERKAPLASARSASGVNFAR